MKPASRNSYLLILGIVELTLFIFMIVLHGKGSMDTVSFVFGFFVLAAITLVGVVVAFYKYPWIQEKKEDDFDLVLVEVPRTHEGTIFEVLTGLILVIAWVVAIATHRFTDADGGFDFGTLSNLFIFTLSAIITLWDVYGPGNMVWTSHIKNVEQLALHIRMCRVLAVEVALLVLSLAVPRANALYCTIIVMVITFAIFRFLIYKARC